MPKGSRAYRLAHLLENKGMAIGPAIATAQKQTGIGYQSGKPLPSKDKKKPKKKKRKNMS